MPFSLFPPSPFFHPLYLRSTHALRHCLLSDGLLSTPLCENVSTGRGRGTFVNVTEGIGGLAAARVCIIFTTSRHHQSPISAHTCHITPHHRRWQLCTTSSRIESNRIEFAEDYSCLRSARGSKHPERVRRAISSTPFPSPHQKEGRAGPNLSSRSR